MVIAVTGDIGAGKSTVSKLLAQKLSCEYLNADVIAKNLWHRDDVKAQAVNHFGDDILDSEGRIIIPGIAELIFTNEDNNAFCNALIHPLVMDELEDLSVQYGDAVIEIPLLFEAGRRKFIDRVIYVEAQLALRLHRCEIQRGWNIGELLRREKFLLPREHRIAMSDYVIHNDKSISELERHINKLGEKLNERK